MGEFDICHQLRLIFSPFFFSLYLLKIIIHLLFVFNDRSSDKSDRQKNPTFLSRSGDDDFNLQNDTPVGVDTRLNGDAGLDDFIFLASNVLRGFIDGGGDREPEHDGGAVQCEGGARHQPA